MKEIRAQYIYDSRRGKYGWAIQRKESLGWKSDARPLFETKQEADKRIRLEENLERVEKLTLRPFRSFI